MLTRVQKLDIPAVSVEEYFFDFIRYDNSSVVANITFYVDANVTSAYGASTVSIEISKIDSQKAAKQQLKPQITNASSIVKGFASFKQETVNQLTSLADARVSLLDIARSKMKSSQSTGSKITHLPVRNFSLTKTVTSEESSVRSAVKLKKLSDVKNIVTDKQQLIKPKIFDRVEKSNTIKRDVKVSLPTEYFFTTNSVDRVDQLVVTFTLRDANEKKIQSITKSVDILSAKTAFIERTSRPAAKVVRIGCGQAKLYITRGDRNTTGVRIYKRGNNEQYSLVSELLFFSDDITTKISVAEDRETHFQIVAIDSMKNSCGQYTSVIVPGKNKNFHDSHVVIRAFQTDLGMKINVEKLSKEFMSYQVLKRDLTLNEKTTDRVAVGDIVESFSFPKTRQNSIIQLPTTSRVASLDVVDTSMKNGHIYEYVLRAYDTYGNSMIVGNEIIQYFDDAKKIGRVLIENQQTSIVNGSPEVTFGISFAFEDSDYDKFRAALKSYDIEKYFGDEFLTNREKLRSVIVYDVERHNLSTGQRESMGIFPAGTYSDKAAADSSGAQRLANGVRYVYTVRPMLRDTETMVENLRVQKTDVTTGKQYTFPISKFKHPTALKAGVISTPETQKQKYVGSQFAFGKIGVYASVAVDFAEQRTSLKNFSVKRLTSSTLMFEWGYDKSPSDIDSCVLERLCDDDGTYEVIGISHARVLTGYGTSKYVYVIDAEDDGAMTYSVKPFYLDYSSGKKITTQVDI